MATSHQPLSGFFVITVLQSHKDSFATFAEYFYISFTKIFNNIYIYKIFCHCCRNAHCCFFCFFSLFHSNEQVCVLTQLAISHKPERSTRCFFCFFLHHMQMQPKNKDAELVCVHLSPHSPPPLPPPSGCVQRGRATWTTRSSCSVPALHLPV